MHSAFYATVISHGFSLVSSLWAICSFGYNGFSTSHFQNSFKILFSLHILNAAVAFIRYGNENIGYKLKRLHLITMNTSCILTLAIVSTQLYNIFNSSFIEKSLATSTFITLAFSLIRNDYKTRLESTDVFVAVNCLVLLYNVCAKGCYYGASFTFSYIFNYFFVGQSGFFFDTEMPCVDLSQYVQIFINIFIVYTFKEVKE